ncbi:MAG TPA: hypothetical protein VMS99_15810 [Acidimicrobiia bacterium]|nr:hypothetical protein [Acidimicrobiia bacterium]
MVTVGLVSLVSGLRRMPPLAFEERGEIIRTRLDYEVGRARRYGGRVSLVAFRAASTGTIDGKWQRFAATMAISLRDFDSYWVDSDRITVVLPETDLAARSRVIDRILGNAELEGLAIEASASTFPDEAPTSDALIRSVTGARDAQLR